MSINKRVSLLKSENLGMTTYVTARQAPTFASGRVLLTTLSKALIPWRNFEVLVVIDLLLVFVSRRATAAAVLSHRYPRSFSRVKARK